MGSVRLFVIFFILISSIVSCSSGEDLENQVLDKKPAVENDQNQIKETADSGSNDEYNMDEDTDAGDVDSAALELIPRIESLKIVRISDQDLTSGLMIQASTNVEDIEITDYYRITWLNNNEVLPGESEETLDWDENFKKGDTIKVALIPGTGDQDSPLAMESVFEVPDSPPQIVSEPPLAIENGKFEYTVVAEDRDGDDIQFLLKNSPKGMTIEPATGHIFWDFTKEKPGTEYNIEIVASDDAGLSYTQELTLTIPEKQPGSQETSEEQKAQ